ncbi:MAG: cell surface protein SprA, partial [Gemmatimonadota bacterium]
SDRVVDGIVDAAADTMIDTLPLCSATVNGQIVSRFFGDPRSRCGRHNGAVDTEDQDGDGQLDVAVGAKTQEDFIRFVFPIGDERFFVRDGGMVQAPVSQGGGASGWRLYRIPFRTDTLQIGAPNLRQVQTLRITVLAPETAPPGAPDPQIFFALSRVRLVGATWLKRAGTPVAGLGGERATGLGEVVASVVSTENRDLGYVPPPGVVNQAARQDQNFQVGTTQINEQSLRVLATGLETGQRAEAFTRFGAEGDKNFLKYRQLRVWARGRGPGWEDGDLEFFFKVGKDADNFYFYHAPARTSSWEPEVVIALDRWVALRAHIQQAWLGGDPPHVYPGCPDSTLVPNDTAYVMCDGAYIAHVKDPGGAPPNLAAVQEIAAGIWRVRSATFIDQAELWVDDIRLSDVVQNAGHAAALDIALTAGNLADLSLDVSRRDGNFRQLGEDPSYQTSQAYSFVTTLHLERLLPPQWGLAAPFQLRYASLSSEPIFLAGTDLRGDALSGLRTPLTQARSFAFSLRRVRRAAAGPARWLADPLSLTASYTSGSDRASLSAATAHSFAVSVDYGLQPRGTTIPAAPRFLVTLVRKLPPFIGKSGFADGLERSRLRLNPTSIRLRSTLSGGDASQTVFRIPVVDSGDRNLTPARSLTRVWRNTASLDLLPLSNVQLRGDLASTRDLRDYGDSSSIARVARLARKSLLGLDVGMETQRTIGTFYGVTPRFMPWLSPRVSLTTGFSLTRDANGRSPVRTDGDSGAFRLPTAFSNSQRAELGTQLDLGRLGRGIFGDSSAVARALGALSALDLGYNRDRISNYSNLAAAPSLGYQLGLVGLGAFLSQHDVPATGATDNTTKRAAGTVSLPLGLRMTGLYQLTRGTSWLLRFTGQVQTRTFSREWPSGILTWTFSPPRATIGRVLSGLTAQLGVRYRQTQNDQPAFGGGQTATTKSDERTIAPGVTASWVHGVLTSFDGTRLRTEQLTAGNTFRNTRTQQNTSVAFAWRPPAALLRLKSDIRTTARYSYTRNATCLVSSGQRLCTPYVDSRQTNAQLTLDTSFPPSLSAGFQMAYVLDDERQINRRIAQLVLTAFLQLNTSVGQVR